MLLVFQITVAGESYPGLASIDREGALLWFKIVDRPGWNVTRAGAEVAGRTVFLGLSTTSKQTPGSPKSSPSRWTGHDSDHPRTKMVGRHLACLSCPTGWKPIPRFPEESCLHVKHRVSGSGLHTSRTAPHRTDRNPTRKRGRHGPLPRWLRFAVLRANGGRCLPRLRFGLRRRRPLTKRAPVGSGPLCHLESKRPP